MNELLNKFRGENALIGAGAALSLFLCSYYAYVSREYQRDDALIYYRYISNVLNGDGLVYNAGEKINAMTSPLYAYISIPSAYVVGDIHLSQSILGGLFLFLAAFVVMMIFRKQEMTVYGVMAAILIVSTPYYYLAFGMETMLFLFLVFLTIYLFMDNRFLLLGLASGLLMLTRGEGILLVLTLMIFYYINQKKLFPGRFFLVFIIVLLPHYLFNYLYFGNLIPHTMSAKIGQGEATPWYGKAMFLRPAKLKTLFQTPFIPGWYLMLTVPAILSVISMRLWIKSQFIRLLIVFLLFYSFLYVLLGVPAYYWYYAVYFMGLTIFAAYGFKAIHDYLEDKWPRKKTASKQSAGRIALAGSLAFFALLLSFQLASIVKIYGAQPHPYYKDIGIWLKENTTADSQVAAAEIGHIGWYSERYIIDIGGLVNDYNAELFAEGDYYSWLEHYDPDYILVHDPLWYYEVAAEGLLKSGTYIYAPGFSFAGYNMLVKP